MRAVLSIKADGTARRVLPKLTREKSFVDAVRRLVA